MINFPTCKINLGLHVLSKREDGFHEIETSMLEVPFTDAIEVSESDYDQFLSAGLTIPGNGNLCIEALQLMRKYHFIPPISIELLKNIPMGGGLGGGSSDAAFTLKAINSYFELNLTTKKLEELASELGSDCPFFIQGGFQSCTGRGEILAPIQLAIPSFYIVLLNFGIHVPTASAYQSIVPQSDRKSILEILNQPKETWRKELVNDFEKPVYEKHPVLAQIKNELYEKGAFYAAMSGSGSTLFGCFEHEPSESFRLLRPSIFEKMCLIQQRK